MSVSQHYYNGDEGRRIRQHRYDGGTGNELFLRRKDLDPALESLRYLRRHNLEARRVRESPNYAKHVPEETRWSNQVHRAAPRQTYDRRNEYEKVDYLDDRKLQQLSLPIVGDQGAFNKRCDDEDEDNNEGARKSKRPKKYQWFEMMEWEMETYGYKKLFPQKVNQIYEAGLKLKCKHPVQLLNEYCQKHAYKPPEFNLVYNGPNKNRGYMFKVVVNGEMFQADYYSQNKKQAKVYGALKALWELGETKGLS